MFQILSKINCLETFFDLLGEFPISDTDCLEDWRCLKSQNTRSNRTSKSLKMAPNLHLPPRIIKNPIVGCDLRNLKVPAHGPDALPHVLGEGGLTLGIF